MRIKRLCLIILIVLLSLPGVEVALAAGSITDEAPAKQTDANFTAGRKAIDAKDWPNAILYLNMAAEKNPRNADVQNYLGYAHRNSGNMDQALLHYAKALELDPKHKGAHEYLGEAYLIQGDLPKAEAMLAKLDKLCTFSCAEYTELKGKIAAYKATHKAS